MIKNYLKIAWRNIWKTKAFSSINIFGLAVGLTACFLITLYVKFELSYDRFHAKSDRIYRLACDITTPSDKLHLAITSAPMGIYLAQDLPEIESYVRVAPSDFLVRKDDIKYQERRGLFADSTLFRIFDFPLLSGDPRTALKAPSSVVLSESASKKYFGDADPVGKSLLVTEEGLPMNVTGVMKDIPENSQLKADMIVSLSTIAGTFKDTLDTQWGNFGVMTYLLLRPNADAAKVSAKFPDFLKNRVGSEMEEMNMHYTLFLDPLTEVYLHSDRAEDVETGNINNIYVFAIVALFLMLVACINFVNLSTARALERAREVGMRKVVGAYRSQITGQFMGESLLISLFAFIIALLLSVLLIPYLNSVAGKEISEGIFQQPQQVLLLLGLALFIGLLAGMYPALVLSSFDPIVVLKGKFASNPKGQFVRSALVTIQFVVSVGLIAGTIIVGQQLRFMRGQELGFNKDQMLVVQLNGDSKGKLLRESVTGLPHVLSASISSSVPGGGNALAYSEVENSNGDMQICSLPLYFVDQNYIPQYQMHLVAGRAFSTDFGTDSTQAMVLNESAIRLLGYASAEDAIGKRYSQWGSEGKIIGVVKDFHFKSLQSKIEPLSMRFAQGSSASLSIKTDGQHVDNVLAAVEKKWRELIPNRPFEYYFADEFFDRQYRAENRFGQLFLNFAILAIFICCLGLFGLASYHTKQRIREIGIRKVLGSSVGGIVRLLSQDFMKLVAIAILIATPLMWVLMSRWLDGFAYHVGVSWWAFAFAGLLAIGIALAVLSGLTIRAARANPVDSLRDE